MFSYHDETLELVFHIFREYEVKNGPSCIGQYGNLRQNGTFYHISFDQWTDIRILYVVVLKQNTPMVGRTLFCGPA